MMVDEHRTGNEEHVEERNGKRRKDYTQWKIMPIKNTLVQRVICAAKTHRITLICMPTKVKHDKQQQ